MSDKQRELVARMRAAVRWEKGIAPTVVAGWADEFDAALAPGTISELAELIRRMESEESGEKLWSYGTILAYCKTRLAAERPTERPQLSAEHVKEALRGDWSYQSLTKKLNAALLAGVAEKVPPPIITVESGAPANASPPSWAKPEWAEWSYDQATGEFKPPAAPPMLQAEPDVESKCPHDHPARNMTCGEECEVPGNVLVTWISGKPYVSAYQVHAIRRKAEQAAFEKAAQVRLTVMDFQEAWCDNAVVMTTMVNDRLADKLRALASQPDATKDAK